MLRRSFSKIGLLLKVSVLFFLRTYQYLISPLLGHCCRFYPTCSSYAQQAIQSYGVIQGTWMTIKRLLRCHPYQPGGYDPVKENNR